jgi:colicin import membrane protein
MNAIGRMLLIVALIVVVAACGATGSDTDRVAELEQQVADLQDQTRVTSAVSRPAPTSAPASQFTRAEENAIGSAESYLGFTAFSRTGLIDQLEYEGFTNADATLAVDYIDVDWNRQAALSAEQYLEFSSFSRSGLIDQLLYEGFTQSQATYGVDRTGL